MSPFTHRPATSVAALGEVRLIAAIQTWLGPASPHAPFGIGDDCAVLRASARRQLITVDPVIYGSHFDDAVTPRAVGAKLLKRNLSDIAAMGGRPRCAVVALALAAEVSLAWLEAFYRGLAATARRYGVEIVGGDVAQQPAGFVATLTLVGEATGARVLTRVGARPGDSIWVTGRLGGSLRGGHHRFTPRLAEGAWLAQQAGVRSMLDLSDGLAKDVLALTPPGARPALEPARIPLSAAARSSARHSGRTALAHALSDGEDYELLFSLAAREDADAFQRRWHRRFPRLPLSRLGRFVAGPTLPLGSIDLDTFHGYEHMRTGSGPA